MPPDGSHHASEQWRERTRTLPGTACEEDERIRPGIPAEGRQERDVDPDRPAGGPRPVLGDPKDSAKDLLGEPVAVTWREGQPGSPCAGKGGGESREGCSRRAVVNPSP